MEVTTKVRPVWLHGSIYEALKAGFLSSSDVLTYLMTLPVSIQTLCAYKAVCLVDTTTTSTFVLQLEPASPNIDDFTYSDYIILHALLCKDIQELLILQKILTVVDFMAKPSYKMRLLNWIADNANSLEQNLNHEYDEIIDMLITSRSVKILANIIKHNGMIKYYLAHDYLDGLKGYDYLQYEDLLLTRCVSLKADAPGYWSAVAVKLYLEHLRQVTNVKYPHICTDKLGLYLELFPDLYSPTILDKPALIHNIVALPTTVQAYVLGWPIHVYIPSEQELNTSLEQLEQLGITGYVQHIAEQNKLSLNCFNERTYINTNTTLTQCNHQDVLSEEIIHYNTFDVVKCYTQHNVSYFTRNEFKSLQENPKNPWTQQAIPICVLKMMSLRSDLAQQYKLPCCAILNDLLEGLSHKVESTTKANTLVSVRSVPLEPILPDLSRATRLPNISSGRSIRSRRLLGLVPTTTTLPPDSPMNNEDVLRVMLETGVDVDEAQQALANHDNDATEAIISLERDSSFTGSESVEDEVVEEVEDEVVEDADSSEVTEVTED